MKVPFSITSIPRRSKMIRTSTLCVLALGFVAEAPAQTQVHSGSLHRTVPVQHGSYDMFTGFHQTQRSYRSGPEVIFDNTLGAEYYFSTLLDTEEWIDECAFAARDLDGDEQINGIRFEYCSLVTGLGATPITAELRFYNDTIAGSGPTGWLSGGMNQNAQCGYIIAGLPGAISPNQTCWEIDVDLECGGLECSLPQEITPGGATEFVGIGWMYRDALASGATGPILDSLVGTTSVGYGAQDYFELFDISTAGHTGTFFFGGGSKLQASFQTTLYGNGIVDTDVLFADNPGAFDYTLCLVADSAPTGGAPVTWSCREDVTPGLTYRLIGSFNGDSAGYGSIMGVGTTLLVDPSAVIGPLAPALMGTVGNKPSLTTPPLPAAVDTQSIYVQAFGMSGGLGTATEASNALRHAN